MFSSRQDPPCRPEAGREGASKRVEETLRSTAELERVLAPLAADLAAAGFAEKDVFAVRLALEEALVNAIRHGNDSDPAKEARLRYEITPERVVAEVEDQGPGFDPDKVPDPLAPENLEKPSGRGLFLIRCYMTWVRFNECGNRVTLCKTRSAG
jgi:serine/threonine-protein kinase RsbW